MFKKGDLVRINVLHFKKRIFRIEEAQLIHGARYYVLGDLAQGPLFGQYMENDLELFEFKIPKYFNNV